jgi:hypothetical protein
VIIRTGLRNRVSQITPAGDTRVSGSRHE